MRVIDYTDHPVVPFLITVILYFLFLLVRLETYDAAFFVQAGDAFVNITEAPDNLFTVTPFTGYDGTFYYRLALDPFTREHTAFGITFDNARYRSQRIVYALLGWFFSFGDPNLVIYSLIFVNYFALCAMGWFSGIYAQTIGRHALWGIVFSLYPGFLFTLSRNLTEIMACFFVLVTLVALQQRRPVFASIALILAILSKETALLVAIAMTIVWVWQRDSKDHALRWYVGIIPCFVYCFWQIWLKFWWHSPLISATQANIGWPFLGMIRGFQDALLAVGGSQARWGIEVGVLIYLAFMTLVMLRRSQAQRYEKLSWSLYCLLLIVLTSQVWIEDWAFLRASSLFYLFSVAILLNVRNVVTTITLMAGVGAYGVVAIMLLYFR